MQEKTFLPTAAVRARYGVTKQSLWRWLHKEALGFPKPIRINNRLFWKTAELEAWENSRVQEDAQHAMAS